MIHDTEAWEKMVEVNKDPYGKAIVDVARRVMELLDEEEYNHTLTCDEASDLINRADEDVGAGGLTGFMAGAVAFTVAKCHSRGEEYRKAWNSGWLKKGEEDKGGVVNPAILSIDVGGGK